MAIHAIIVPKTSRYKKISIISARYIYISSKKPSCRMVCRNFAETLRTAFRTFADHTAVCNPCRHELHVKIFHTSCLNLQQVFSTVNHYRLTGDRFGPKEEQECRENILNRGQLLQRHARGQSIEIGEIGLGCRNNGSGCDGIHPDIRRECSTEDPGLLLEPRFCKIVGGAAWNRSSHTGVGDIHHAGILLPVFGCTHLLIQSLAEKEGGP